MISCVKCRNGIDRQGRSCRYCSWKVPTDITNLPASAFRSTYDPPDTTLIKLTRPATCAVCRQVVTASIVLPSEQAVCEFCAGVALRGIIADAEAYRKMADMGDATICLRTRNMIDDASACRGSR